MAESAVSDVAAVEEFLAKVPEPARARTLGLDRSVGTLAVGREADLIAVGGDPSVRIGDLRGVQLVMKSGAVVARNGQVLEPVSPPAR